MPIPKGHCTFSHILKFWVIACPDSFFFWDHHIFIASRKYDVTFLRFFVKNPEHFPFKVSLTVTNTHLTNCKKMVCTDAIIPTELLGNTSHIYLQYMLSNNWNYKEIVKRFFHPSGNVNELSSYVLKLHEAHIFSRRENYNSSISTVNLWNVMRLSK